MSERQKRVLQFLADPSGREFTELSRRDCCAIARCLAERTELLTRIELDAKLFRSVALFFHEVGGTGIAKDLEGYVDDTDRIIARMYEGGAL